MKQSALLALTFIGLTLSGCTVSHQIQDVEPPSNKRSLTDLEAQISPQDETLTP